MLIRHRGGCRWQNIPVMEYKAEEGTHFKDITRQVLLEGQSLLPCQVRYFEIAADGYSTLERHEHLHYVIIAKGTGHALVGDEIYQVQEHDVIMIPSFSWHQFQATSGQPLGFLCMVHTERDKVQLPTQADLEKFNEQPEVAAFIRR